MSSGIFDGLKVLDFTWAAAGPIITKQLGDNGATVIKIESDRHPDSIRLGGPFIDAKPGLNRSGFFADFNSNKLSIAVDLGHAGAKEVVNPLIAWADVIVESFRPGMMARWGIDYECVHKINPSVIMVSSSLYGQSGPWAQHPGFGAQGAALTGIHAMTGWPDRPPAAPKGAYTDSVSPRFGASALMAAMIHRDRTGEGQYIEISQIETGITLLTPELLEMQITGKEPMRSGNQKTDCLIHGVYPCAGDENWIVVEVQDEQVLQALLGVLSTKGRPGIALSTEVSSSRHDNEAIDAAMAELTVQWNSYELMEALRAVGVPAGVAYRGSDLLEDQVLRDRGHYWSLTHPEMGTLDYNGPAYRFSETPTELTRAAPCLGQDTDNVLRNILGLDTQTIDKLKESEVLR